MRSKARAVQTSLWPDIVPDQPIGSILPSVFRGDNADLMDAIAPYYLTASVCDLTYGKGKWWTRYRPDPFTAHDLYTVDGVDFRDLPEPDDTYDTVCYDPPYVISGSTDTSTRHDFHEAYGIGLRHLATGGSSLEEFIAAGLREAIRVSRQWVLVKCMEFAQGDTFHDIPHTVTVAALSAGCVKHDQIVHHTGTGPGGHNIFDPVRARRHHSYLLVFRKERYGRVE